ncbi:MEDS domain-containing protein [Blastococcus sp. PRF04-17]|uniref:MEDS domain-containing protein n=1 Tax=Blastococcus sp. PRF04-17 TaxID=2933797 RepID=UPI001FF122BF|nr:MEDS domain-containing protein [Blastococcus sp. PRF04-17]UOY02217.1 MEDS domain-containing protein [Blastococcus sp. PRF04-17]
MRPSGLVSEVPRLDATDHLCWVYDDDASFDQAVERFLSGGLARGERLLCVGDEVVDRMRGDAAPIPGVPALVASGALDMLTVADAYQAAGEFTPERQFEFYEKRTRQAIDDGYTGLRVVAELSALAADTGRRAELVRWEHVADGFMASGSGMTAMCAYRGDLPADALADVASVHPLVRAPDGTPSFRVFFDEDRVVVAGDVDTFGADRLAALLASSPVGPERAVLDLGPVEFVDVAAARVLARWARALQARSVAVEIRGASPLFGRMWRVLGLGDLVPVTFGQRAG